MDGMSEQAVNRIIHNMVDTALYLAGRCYTSVERTRAELAKIVSKDGQSQDEKYKLEIVMRYMDDGLSTAAMILNELYGAKGDHQRIISAIKVTEQSYMEREPYADRVGLFERALAESYDETTPDYAALAETLLKDWTENRRKPIIQQSTYDYECGGCGAVRTALNNE